MNHLVKVKEGYRVSWPFGKMAVGDCIVFRGVNAKAMRNRGMIASMHYKEKYGRVFQSDRTDVQEYTIKRVK